MLTAQIRRFAEAATSEAVKAAPQIVRKPIPGIGRIIMASGSKGGIGKSTIAVNTAAALVKNGATVGIFDANIYAPSIARMVGTTSIIHEANTEANFYPIIAHGIETVSVANVIDSESSLTWKSPYVAAVLGDFLKKALWSDLDYLIIDTPTGTGDIPMALCTMFPVDGALIVTTPDQLSANTVIRCVDMFKRMPVPIVGVV